MSFCYKKCNKSIEYYALVSYDNSIGNMWPADNGKGGNMKSDRLSQEELSAIKDFRQIDVLMEMYENCLLGEPWVEVDRERLEKLESAFYLLHDQLKAKRQQLEAVFIGE